MNRVLCVRWMRMVLVGAATVAITAVGMPTASSEPGIPGTEDASCESYGFGNTAMACDGPIREDGTWRRCAQWQPWYVPGPYGSYTPGGSKCWTVEGGADTGNPLLPQHHIDG